MIRREQGAFDVNVRVDEAGNDRSSPSIDLSARFEAGFDADDGPVDDRDLARAERAAEDVEITDVFDEQVAWNTALGRVDASLERSFGKGGFLVHWAPRGLIT
jgi:hypothetical protein